MVGLLNTALDFAIFNILSGKKVGWGKLISNTVSTSVAMICSFLLNRTFVFSGHGNPLAQALLFIVITAFGLYVLQNGTIYLLTHVWDWPSRFVARLIDSLHIPFRQDLVLKNSAKIIGTGISLIWNYLLYSKVVFRVYS